METKGNSTFVRRPRPESITRQGNKACLLAFLRKHPHHQANRPKDVWWPKRGLENVWDTKFFGKAILDVDDADFLRHDPIWKDNSSSLVVLLTASRGAWFHWLRAADVALVPTSNIEVCE